ncbi:Uncharacterised protein [Candidatus Gugararchaeum adminiculabundum]|nr:Uncharacterised protein [Candidatus Gugararchaeum adminiculabundum]
MEFWQVVVGICAIVTVCFIILTSNASEALKYSAVLALLWLFSVIYVMNEITQLKKEKKKEDAKYL